MSNKLCLPFLETMITQVCNLSCLGCTNYSDLKHAGYVSWQEGKQWLDRWLKKIDILDFGIMGGEPLINPEYKDWLIGVRELLPHSQIRFTTNGLLLHQHPELIDLMYELGNVSFKITVHVNDSKLENSIQQIFDRYNWKPVTEHGIDRWITGNNFRFHVKRPQIFLKTYQNDYNNMMPWNSSPEQAFKYCIQQTCPLLHQGLIYKCSTSGLLNQTLLKMAPQNIEHWQKYLTPGISPDCDHEVLTKFVNNFGKHHSQCGQCPDFAQFPQSQIDHYHKVEFK